MLQKSSKKHATASIFLFFPRFQLFARSANSSRRAMAGEEQGSRGTEWVGCDCCGTKNYLDQDPDNTGFPCKGCGKCMYELSGLIYNAAPGMPYHVRNQVEQIIMQGFGASSPSVEMLHMTSAEDRATFIEGVGHKRPTQRRHHRPGPQSTSRVYILSSRSEDATEVPQQQRDRVREGLGNRGRLGRCRRFESACTDYVIRHRFCFAVDT